MEDIRRIEQETKEELDKVGTTIHTNFTICLPICICVHLHACVCVYIMCVCVHVHVHFVCVCVCVRACVYACMHIILMIG